MKKIPIFILADHNLDDEFSRKKIFELKIGDKLILQSLVEEIEKSDLFSEIYLIGNPIKLKKLFSLPIFTGQHDLKKNIKIIFDFSKAKFPNQLIAIITCDILPKSEDFKRFFEKIEKKLESSNLIFCFILNSLLKVFREADTLIKNDEEKPKNYNLVYNFFILRPDALNKKIIYFLIDLLRPLRKKRITNWSRFLLCFLKLIILIPKYPFVLFFLPKIFSVISLFKKYLKGNLKFSEIEKIVETIFIKRKNRKGKTCYLEVIDIPSFAEDIDTEKDYEILKKELQ